MYSKHLHERAWLFLGQAGQALSGLAILILACEVLNKVLIYQTFSNSGVHSHKRHNVMPKQSYNMCTCAIFTDIDLIYSHQGKYGGGGAQSQKIIEKCSCIKHMPYTLVQFSAQEHLKILRNTFWSEFLFNNLAICCVAEKF